MHIRPSSLFHREHLKLENYNGLPNVTETLCEFADWSDCSRSKWSKFLLKCATDSVARSITVNGTVHQLRTALPAACSLTSHNFSSTGTGFAKQLSNNKPLNKDYLSTYLPTIYLPIYLPA